MRWHSTARKTSLNFGDPFFNFNAAFLLSSAILWMRDVNVSVAIIYTQFHIHNKFKVKVIAILLRILLWLRSTWRIAQKVLISWYPTWQKNISRIITNISVCMARSERLVTWTGNCSVIHGSELSMLSVSVTLSEDTRFAHMKQVERCYSRAILVVETTLSHSICAQL